MVRSARSGPVHASISTQPPPSLQQQPEFLRSAELGINVDIDKVKLAIIIAQTLNQEQLEQLSKKHIGSISDADIAAVVGRPLRTVIYVDIAGMNPADARVATQSLMATMPVGHPHFVVPVRNGKIATDVQFEAEILETIKKLCEVKDGEIVFRDVAKDVEIIRHTI